MFGGAFSPERLKCVHFFLLLLKNRFFNMVNTRISFPFSSSKKFLQIHKNKKMFLRLLKK